MGVKLGVWLKGEYRLGLFKNRVVWKILGPKRDEVCPSVCPHGTTRLPADGFWWNLISRDFLEYLSRKCKFNLKPTRITGTLHGDVFTFPTGYCYIILRMRNVLDKSFRENQNTRFVFYKVFSENRAVYEIMSKNVVEPEGPQMTSQHGAFALHAG